MVSKSFDIPENLYYLVKYRFSLDFILIKYTHQKKVVETHKLQTRRKHFMCRFICKRSQNEQLINKNVEILTKLHDTENFSLIFKLVKKFV